MTKGADAVLFQGEEIFQFEVEGIAKGGEVKQVLAELFSDHFTAVFAHFALDM